MLAELTESQVSLLIAAFGVVCALCGWFGRGIGYIAIRRLTGAKRQEDVSYYTALTDLAGKLKERGMSIGEVTAFEATMQSPTMASSEDVSNFVSTSDHYEIDKFASGYAMRARAGAAFEVAEAQLSQVFCDLKLLIEDEEEPFYDAMREKWVAYRLALMSATGSQFGEGTFAPLAGTLAGMSETERWTAELRNLVDNRARTDGGVMRLLDRAL